MGVNGWLSFHVPHTAAFVYFNTHGVACAIQKLMLDLARDDLIPGRLEAFMDSAVQYTKNNMFKQLALMVIARCDALLL